LFVDLAGKLRVRADSARTLNILLHDRSVTLHARALRGAAQQLQTKV